MIDYRPFRNSDPPALCEIWRNQPPLRGRFGPLTTTVLETVVFSKPFFDRHGLIVAVEDDRPIGFVHAGFGAAEDGCGLDTSLGATCMLLVAPHVAQAEVVGELLRRSEAYLRARGARQLHAGGSAMVAPFYLGLYGGATISGLLASDRLAMELFTAAGYVESGRGVIVQRQLASFRAPVDRLQLQMKRGMRIDASLDPRCDTWWEACTIGLTDRFAYAALPRSGTSSVGQVVFWDMEPLASSWGVHARGLVQLELDAESETEPLGVFLLGESFRMMAADGATLVEVHIDKHDDALRSMLRRLGFEEVEQTVHLVKQIA